MDGISISWDTLLFNSKISLLSRISTLSNFIFEPSFDTRTFNVAMPVSLKWSRSFNLSNACFCKSINTLKQVSTGMLRHSL